MIYAVSILNDQFVKVGYSQYEDVAIRIAALQTGSPFEIVALFTTFGNLMQEKRLHASLGLAFSQIKVPMPPNEWYPGRNHFFKTFLDFLRYGPEAAIAFCESHHPLHGDHVKRSGFVRLDWTPNFKWPVKADYTEQRLPPGYANPARKLSQATLGGGARKRRPMADEAKSA